MCYDYGLKRIIIPFTDYKMADEEDFLNLIIANELVSNWIEILKTSKDQERIRDILVKLKDGIERSDAYLEEVINAGAIGIINKYIESKDRYLDSDDIISISKDINDIYNEKINKLKKIDVIKYGNIEIKINQGLLNDGIGAKLWNVAHSFNNFIIEKKTMLINKSVLELGSGCGSTGILSYMLGASEVVMTDYIPNVLFNLKKCMHLNYSINIEDELNYLSMNDDDLFNDALSMDSNDEFNMNDWDLNKIKIKYLNWNQPYQKSHELDIPYFDTEVNFDIIIGCEVLYEAEHSKTIPTVISKFLNKNGHCYIAGAVREKMIFDDFENECRKNNLECKIIKQIHSLEKIKEYENGIIIYSIEHAHI